MRRNSKMIVFTFIWMNACFLFFEIWNWRHGQTLTTTLVGAFSGVIFLSLLLWIGIRLQR